MSDKSNTSTTTALVPAKDIRLLRCLPYQPVPIECLPMFQREILMLCAKFGLVTLAEDEATYMLTEVGQAAHTVIYGALEVAHGH
jgi:hypothetical protein